ncbi:hypothetical protein LMB33_08260 [Limosilactobacillus reuteri]|uniref:hypothetical protein n=1 Tax=Limosilactobacillus reuteri TaxID=1598 RepID=UPI001E373069|nr:hypothetical protein [Limosilactobacillus reuteri]MCC4325057.1 hypothetical protein [Limosilactobacillus reuteri]MCC4330364.1 hypothetical protein [Limosilactobacillus reuteri]MCC4351883.1 hypothetical protein [Limosilactobacillus reuteri]MCC4376592.1 hypothetical protein [Limosilactobacillus reuteri]
MIAYKNCIPNDLDYTVGKGGKTTIRVNGKDIVLTFKDVPAKNPKYMNIKIFSVPKHVMASIIINAYLKDDTNNLDINKKVKEKLANCINTAVRNRFGLI